MTMTECKCKPGIIKIQTVLKEKYKVNVVNPSFIQLSFLNFCHRNLHFYKCTQETCCNVDLIIFLEEQQI